MQINQSTVSRKVVATEGFTFSDGTNIPYGAFLSVASNIAHMADNYECADVFDGFRFRGCGETIATKRVRGAQATTTSSIPTWSPRRRTTSSFGTGVTRVLGGFSRRRSSKAILAHILINYDVRAESDVFGLMRIPGRDGRIWIRNRSRE
ncbi:hypothetical protein C8R44DRAFT_821247 [Mycena epipterygia]|nr:hypothetical protein C8R44DRAFT_821247 [Mycena epipterygia]